MRLRRPRTFDRISAACLGLAGLMFVLPGGCSRQAEETFETFSAADADAVESQRQVRKDEAAAADLASTPEKESDETSEVVLSAAQRVSAAATSRISTADQPGPPEESLRSSPGEDVTSEVNSTLESPGGDETPGDEESLAMRAAARVASAVDGEPVVRMIKLLIPERSFAVEGPGDALRVSYDDFDLLKVLNMEPVPPNATDHFPKWLSDLDGKKVRVRGFMYPTFQETDIPGFVLARDNQICCFGRNPKIYDLVEVTLKDGVTTDYIQGRPFDVVGTFHIRPEADDGELWQLYQIDDAIVIDE